MALDLLTHSVLNPPAHFENRNGGVYLNLEGRKRFSTDRLVAYKVCVACARDIRSAGTQTHQEKVVAYVF